jgi:hypothetical protein
MRADGSVIEARWHLRHGLAEKCREAKGIPKIKAKYRRKL